MRRAVALLAPALLAGCGDKAPADKDAIPAEVKAANVAQAPGIADAGNVLADARDGVAARHADGKHRYGEQRFVQRWDVHLDLH